MTPGAKREAVQKVQQKHGLCQRRAARLVQCHRTTARLVSRRQNDDPLRQRLRSLAAERPALGYRMLGGLLRQQCFGANHKKVYRIYKEEALELRRKGKKRLKSEGGCPLGGVCRNPPHRLMRNGPRNGPWTSSMTPWRMDAAFAS